MTTEDRGKRARVLSGMRPTGRLHIGHYFGALQNWVRLQNDPAYECFYFIADWHALTSDYADTSAVAENTLQIMIDYLAAGLDPKKCVIFQQSLIPEHAELFILLSMVTPLGWLERVPTYKEALENIKDKDLHNYGFLGYPVLQCADIVMYSEEGKKLFVPVGEDQVSHVETSREIVVRFNNFYSVFIDPCLREKNFAWIYGEIANALRMEPIVPGGLNAFRLSDDVWSEVQSRIRRRIQAIGIENALDLLKLASASDYIKATRVLSEPAAMLTKTPRIPGLDGRKMSKSYGNTITLSESDADIRAKTKVMMTDPARKRRTDPGNPDVCPVYDWHKLFSTKETLDWAAHGCRTAGIGCIECKAKMADHLIEWITPIRERRLYYEGKGKLVRKIIQDGSLEARRVAVHTMRRVRDAVFGKERILRKKHQAGLKASPKR